MTTLLISNGRVLRTGGKLLRVVPADIPATPVGSLALADFTADLTPFQRVGTTKAIPVHGTCDPGVSSVQVRAVIAVIGGAAHTEWMSIPASGGVFSGWLEVPQGDWCKLQVTDGTNTVTTTNRFGVGVIGLLIGQSNMENRPKTAFKSPLGDPRCIEYNRLAQLRRLGNYRTDSTPPPNSTVDVSGYSRAPGYVQQTDARGDGYVYLANQLAQALGCIVCLVERARGGSNILDWVGLGSPEEDKWAAAADAIRAIGGDCEFALWLQGETNAHTTSTSAMVGHLGTLLAQCHALTGRNASNFHLGVGSLGPGSFNGSIEGEFGNMRAAQVQFANSTPGAFFAGSAHDGTNVDSVHWNGELHARFGLRNAAALLARFGIGKSGAGPRIVSASYANGFVDFMVQHSGGTALQDGAGGAGAALTGFAFKDAGGSTVTYGATSFPAADRIRVAVNGVPATASYAMMNNPHNSNPADPMSAYVPASVPCDNVPFLYSTGAPLQPCPAINITGS